MKLKDITAENIKVDDIPAILIKNPRPVKWISPITGEYTEFDNFKILAIRNNPNKVRIHFDNGDKPVYHYNFNTGESYYYDNGMTVKSYFQAFCCPDIDMKVLYNNPYAIHILMDCLENPNPADAYTNNIEKTVSLTRMDYHISCKKCGCFIPNTISALNQLVELCPACIDGADYNEISNKGIYIKKTNESVYKWYPKNNINGEYVSKYYKPIKACDVFKELENIPKSSVDLTCLGLGSGGTNILAQLGRTNFINSFVLVDDDIVEVKNLRNQFYHRSNIGFDKSASCKAILESFKKTSIKDYNRKFQEVNFKFFKSKYTILGFDTIKTRIEGFNEILNNNIESQYIIDLRYKDLEASIYFVNTAVQEELDYYKQSLDADNKVFKDDVFMPVTPALVHDFFRDTGLFHSRCAHYTSLYFKTRDNTICRESSCDCGSNTCVTIIADKINSGSLLIPGLTTKSAESLNEGCIAQNIIDIYTFASTYITSAIREVENNRDKPFLHLEATTEGMPRMIQIA